MFKKILMVLGGVIVFAVLIVAGVFYFTADMTKTADKFFSLAAQDKWDEASKCLSKDFLSSTTMDQLKDYLAQGDFKNYKDSSWGSRKVSRGIGEIEGKINTHDGGAIPLEITFIKEEDGWKIQHIQKTDAGVAASSKTKEIPTEAQLVNLAKVSMSDFIAAVNAADFSPFYKNISKLWQAQTDPGKLNEAFDSFIKAKFDWPNLEKTEPLFDEKPEIDDVGRLVLKGYFPTKSYIIYFKLSYIYEHPEWKLFGINVDVKKM